MTVHIGEVSSEVVAVPSPGREAGEAARPSVWEEQERLRYLAEARERDRMRTDADGFDD